MKFPIIVFVFLCFILFLGCKDKVCVEPKTPEPEIKTLSITQFGRNFSCNGYVFSHDDLPIIEKGICWDTLQNPTIDKNKTLNNVDTSYFTCQLPDLKKGTKYYVRVFAVTNSGVFYGNELSVTNPAHLIVGDLYGGGIIGYILPTIDSGQIHGIVLAPYNPNDTAIWGGDIYNYYGAGKENTENSVKKFGLEQTAARICYDLVIDGYDDWYLPSGYEFYLISSNWKLVGNFKLDRLYLTSSHFIYNPFSEEQGPILYWYNDEKFSTWPISLGPQVYKVKMCFRPIRLF